MTLAGTLLVTAAWAWVLLGRSASWLPWLRVVIAIAAAGAAAMILAGPGARAATSRGRAALAIAPLSLALAAGLGGQLASSIDTAATTHGGSIPTAGPDRGGSLGRSRRRAAWRARGGFPAARTGQLRRQRSRLGPDPSRAERPRGTAPAEDGPVLGYPRAGQSGPRRAAPAGPAPAAAPAGRAA